jgi:hypothetical protein
MQVLQLRICGNVAIKRLFLYTEDNYWRESQWIIVQQTMALILDPQIKRGIPFLLRDDQ